MVEIDYPYLSNVLSLFIDCALTKNKKKLNLNKNSDEEKFKF